MTGSPSVAIVGAGVSGLAAARRLAERGLAARVFEKSRGVGGRAAVRRQEDLQFDHGAQYFTVADPRFRQPLNAWLADGVAAEWRADVVVLDHGVAAPARPRTRFVGVPAMNSMVKHLGQSLDIATGVRITSAVRAGERWRLGDEHGQDLGDFDAVILTPPPAQSAALLGEGSSLAAAANRVSMQPCWAVMAAFEHRLDAPFDAAFVHASPLSWIARDSSKPGRPSADCWVLHASPAWSAAHLEHDASFVIEELLRALRKAANVELPTAMATSAHRWRYASPSDPRERRCLTDEPRRLTVCGDWLHGARIEGAYLSGLAAADEVSRWLAD